MPDTDRQTEPSSSHSTTIFDVARLAGVSHQTVSRVLNDLPNVRATTRARVETAIQQLQYVPSSAARALVTRRSRTIGLIQTGGPDYGPSHIAAEFTSAAGAAQYAVSTINAGNRGGHAIRAAIGSLLRQSVEAIVLIAARTSALEAVRSLDIPVPLVAVEPMGEDSISGVGIDQYRGARMAVAYLVEMGHRRIAHIAGPKDACDAIERRRGYRDEMEARGLEPLRLAFGDWSPRSGYGAAGTLLRDQRFTALFASNDQMALGAMRVLEDNGWRVPDDVSIVGFDDIPEAEYLSPALTTIRQDFGALGRSLMREVASILREPAARPFVTMRPDLVVRSSVKSLLGEPAD